MVLISTSCSYRWSCSFLFIVVFFLAGCSPSGTGKSTLPSSQSFNSHNAVHSATDDSYLEVDCLLPGQVRKLGRMTYMSPRRPAKTTAIDCEIRGGEYVAYDRANYDSALAIWMGQAGEGDASAMTYVGEIYMRSPESSPRYDLARNWFEKAAKKGFKRAQINLGYLYENGLGGPQDMGKATAWYSRASGANAEDILQQYRLSVKQKQDLAELKEANSKSVKQLENLKNELDSSKAALDVTKGELANRTIILDTQQKEIQAQKKEIALATKELTQQRKQDQQTALELELADMRKMLVEKEKNLAQKQLVVASLTGQVTAFNKKTESYQGELKQLSQRIKNLPGPKIEVLDPQLLQTRGLIVAPVGNFLPTRQISGKVWAPAGLSQITINGDVAVVDAEGIFRKKMVLGDSDTSVIIIARDQNKRSDKIEFVLSTESRSIRKADTKTTVGRSIDFGKYHALVIGNNKYNTLPRLKTAVYDAQEVSRVMRDQYGFQVVTLLDADRKTILSQLNDFRKKLTEKDNFLIYYAGHGTLEEKNTIGYWLPVDAALDDSTNWLRTDDVTGIMNLISAKQILVIADACYSGIMTRAALTRLTAGKSKEAHSKWLKKMVTYKSRIVISSGETKPVLDGGGGGHSVFAKAFLETLQENSDVLMGVDLHRAIAERVMSASAGMGMEQVPQYAGLNRAGHELGDFILVPSR